MYTVAGNLLVAAGRRYRRHRCRHLRRPQPFTSWAGYELFICDGGRWWLAETVQLPVSQSPASQSSRTSRRTSLPLSARAIKPHLGFESPDASVNAPRIDKMTDFPLTSSQEPLILPVRRTSSTSAHCSSNSKRHPGPVSYNRHMYSQDREPNPQSPNICSGAYSINNRSDDTSSDSRGHRRRFDMSSYQQRAEALEGLLEFSAQLMQQERIEELAVLLKPFGPEKVSPRETAIWLSKSFKGTTAATGSGASVTGNS